MIISPDKFEKIFDPFLLREVEISYKDKIIRRGKLKMVMMKNNIIKLYLTGGLTLKIVELYYPFDVKIYDDKIILDYHIKKLTKNNLYLELLINSFNSPDKSPFYDNEVYIKIVE